MVRIALANMLSAAAMLGIAASASAQERPRVNPETWPQAQWPISRDAKVERRISDLIARMTVEEKVGQVIQADIASVTPDDVRDYHLGAVLNGGNSGPDGDDFAAAPRWLALADAFYAASIDRRAGRAAIPVIWGIDAVHGHSNIVGATLFPHNIGLGAANDPALIERIGAATAAEIRVTGQEWTFAPTITVPQNPRWGRTYEGYSSDPQLVARYAEHMIRGLQGPPKSGPLLAGPHVLATAKHFIADGGTVDGRDQGDARIDERTLRDIHGHPYIPAISQGVATVMTSFSSWNGSRIAGDKEMVTDVLKKRMGFGGFVLTDWNAHAQIPGCSAASCPQVINAGVDMYMAPDSWKALHASLVTQVRDGTVPRERLDDAVANVLRVKFGLGLFDAGPPSSRPLAGQWQLLGAPQHRAIAREAVAKSLVLLKNDGVLPLKKGANILVAGAAADDIGQQSGGWTISWQGTGLTKDRFPGATSIWAGIQAAVTKGGGRAELSPDGRFTTRPDAAIIVFGETPYAEFQGDLPSLQLAPDISRDALETMKRLESAGIPVVAVMLTGRPLFVGPHLNTASAFVVAWLPGSEGAGVADRLFAKGGKAPLFTGRLPMAWPGSARSDGPVLFARGFGLTGRGKPTAWANVSEDPGTTAGARDNAFLVDGKPDARTSLSIGDGARSDKVTLLPFTGAAGRITVRAVDDRVQEGARAFELRGGGAQRVSLDLDKPVDLRLPAYAASMMVMRIRLDSAAAPDFRIGVHCGDGCDRSVALPPIAASAWTTVGIPLKCFGPIESLKAVTSPLVLQSAESMRFSLSEVFVGTTANAVATCDQPGAG
jgi:beta-glucosidase